MPETKTTPQFTTKNLAIITQQCLEELKDAPDLERNQPLIFDPCQKNDEATAYDTSNTALRDAQKAFRGAAEEIGVKNEEDVMELIREIRYDSAPKTTQDSDQN